MEIILLGKENDLGGFHLATNFINAPGVHTNFKVGLYFTKQCVCVCDTPCAASLNLSIVARYRFYTF